MESNHTHLFLKFCMLIQMETEFLTQSVRGVSLIAKNTYIMFIFYCVLYLCGLCFYYLGCLSLFLKHTNE